ncbi:MAG: ATP-binding protein [Ignavibacteriaceae bacterium]
MIKKATGILSNTKIAVIGFFLVLIPCIILSYLDYQAISKRTDTVKSNYKFTIDLVRDKIEHEIISREENLSTTLSELHEKLETSNYLESWLSTTETQNPFIINPFILKQDGGIVSALISSRWQKSYIELPQVSKYILSDFGLAEKAEFRERDFNKAANIYNNALKNATSEDSVLLFTRIARCYLYNHDYSKAIEEYKQLLKFKGTEFTIGSVPASVVALSQIADVYTAMHEYRQCFNIRLNLYNMLLENPWNVSDGEYFYYLKSVSTGVQSFCKQYAVDNSVRQTITSLKESELKIYKQDSLVNFIRKNILPKIEFTLKHQSSNKYQLRQLQYQEKDEIYQLGYFIIPNSSQKTGPCLFGFQINNNYILTNILPETLKKIDLGNNISVGLLDAKDSILYLQDKLDKQKYLLTENFSQIFTSWKVALFNGEGKSIAQLIDQEKQQSFLLFGVTLFVMLIGIIVIIITAIHEYQISLMKSDFVSNVSHELKTPLSIIRMFSETLESGIVTDKNKRQEFYGIMKRESEQLTNLINNVLDFSRIESRKKEFNYEETDLVEVVRNVIETYKPQIIAQGFQFEVNIPEKEIISHIDKDAISRAILNLLTNALKYTNERKYILVEMYKAQNSVVISVTDYGIGIPKKEFKNIFENFYRISTSRTNQIKGTGLGLTIAKYIIEAHKGTISVESEVDKGSKFTITIPA